MHLLLLHKDALLCQRILDLLEGREHRLAVGRDRGVVVGARPLDLRRHRAAVEQGRGKLRADRPDRIAELQQRAQPAAHEADGRPQRDRRIEGALRNADLGIGRGHASFGTRDVGPTLQQGRGNAGSDRRDGKLRRRWPDADFRRGATNQQGDRVLQQRPVGRFGHELRARQLVLRLRLRQVETRGDAGIHLVLHDLHGPPVGGHGGFEEPLAVVGNAQPEIVGRQIALRR